MKKVWCPMCRDFVKYETEEVAENFSAWAGKKRLYKLQRLYARCPICKTVINVSRVEDENVRRGIDAIHESDKEAR